MQSASVSPPPPGWETGPVVPPVETSVSVAGLLGAGRAGMFTPGDATADGGVAGAEGASGTELSVSRTVVLLEVVAGGEPLWWCWFADEGSLCPASAAEYIELGRSGATLGAVGAKPGLMPVGLFPNS